MMSRDPVTKAAEEAAKRLRLEVTDVWVLEKVTWGHATDGGVDNEPIGAFANLERGKQDPTVLNHHGSGVAWRLCRDNETWTTNYDPAPGDTYYLLSKFPLIH